MKALLLTVVFLLLSAPALAAASGDAVVLAFTEAEDEQEAPATTTVSEGGVEPAEMAPSPEDSEAEDQWTAKFLAPTVAVLGVVGIVLAFAFYMLRVRARYRVAE